MQYRSHSHSTAETAGLRAAAVGLGWLRNYERLFIGVGVRSMDRVMREAQGAAVPHWGLGYIQDLITHGFLVTVVGEVIRETQTAAPTHNDGRGGGEVGGGDELKREWAKGKTGRSVRWVARQKRKWSIKSREKKWWRRWWCPPGKAWRGKIPEWEHVERKHEIPVQFSGYQSEWASSIIGMWTGNAERKRLTFWVNVLWADQIHSHICPFYIKT